MSDHKKHWNRWRVQVDGGGVVASYKNSGPAAALFDTIVHNWTRYPALAFGRLLLLNPKAECVRRWAADSGTVETQP